MVFQGVKHLITNPSGGRFDTSFGNDVNLGCVFGKNLVSYKNWAKDTTEPQFWMGKTSLSSIDNITFIHYGEENDKEKGNGKGKARQEDQEEERESYHLPKDLRHLQLPTVNFRPNNARENLLHKSYSTQKKINSWIFKAFEKMNRKLKRTPGYVSSEEEEIQEEEGGGKRK
ncbi:unnamed protein product [Cochlearia groenlandica]